MTATVLLVRHAAHNDLGSRLTGRAAGVALSPAGEQQAAQLGLRLAREPVAVLQSSPRERALATAAPLARLAGLAVEPASALDEIDFGAWTGRSFAELRDDRAWAHWNAARAQASPPGGESMVQAQARAVAHVTNAAQRHPGAVLVMVSHCDVIRAVVAHVLALSLDHVLRFDVDPASVSRLVVGAWGARVVSLNEKVCA